MLGKALKYIGESSLLSRKTPHFWHENGFIAQALIPLAVIYFLVKRLNFSKPDPKKFPAKIICVGNAIAGGAGKTPTAISLYKELKKLKPSAKIAFVSTGFKGRIYGPVKVDITQHNYKDVGDEALLLAQAGDAIICKSRLEAVEYASSQNYEYIILDDGLHDKKIVKDLSFLVIDGKYGFGNGIVMPAGPLRDRLDYAIEGTDQIILIGEDTKKSISKAKKFGRKNFPVIRSFIDVVTPVDEKRVYVAFAGIGRPQKFFDMLKNEMKLAVVETVEFADHYNYDSSDIEHLLNVAELQKAKLITTEKDFIKLPKEFAEKVECIRIELKFEDKDIGEVLSKL